MTLPPGYDRRLTPANGRVAAAYLEGKVPSERYVEAGPVIASAIVVDICSAPDGARDRQLLLGEVFMSLERNHTHIFGYAEKDGYVGWVDSAAFADGLQTAPTHYVSTPRTYAKSTSGLKEMGQTTQLPFGVRLVVLCDEDGWSKVAWHRDLIPRDLYVPSQHLTPIGELQTDPVSVAELFLGTPYLWGGNSAFGIDCSGLVQAAFLACGLDCPGDSDLQQASLGTAVTDNGPCQRGDLLFWQGHVAMVVDGDTLIHANAHHMAVAYEPIETAIDRIAAQGDGPVTAHKRVNR